MRAIFFAILLQIILMSPLFAQSPDKAPSKATAPEWELKAVVSPNLSWKYQKTGASSATEKTNLVVEPGICISYLFTKHLSAGIGFCYATKAGREELYKDTFTVERLAYLDIPVFLHLIVYNKGRLKPFVEAAYIFNTLLSRNAYFINAANSKFAEAKESRADLVLSGYKGGTGSFYISIGAQYSISDKINLSLAPYYKPQLSSYTADVQTNDTRFRSIGIQVGAALRF